MFTGFLHVFFFSKFICGLLPRFLQKLLPELLQRFFVLSEFSRVSFTNTLEIYFAELRNVFSRDCSIDLFRDSEICFGNPTRICPEISLQISLRFLSGIPIKIALIKSFFLNFSRDSAIDFPGISTRDSHETTSRALRECLSNNFRGPFRDFWITSRYFSLVFQKQFFQKLQRFLLRFLSGFLLGFFNLRG